MKGDEAVRVQKVLADRGLASRREAESWISEGRVTVNGVTASLGDKCHPARDDIRVDDNPVPRAAPQKVVLALNKPRGYLCTNRDPHGGRTVFDLLPPELRQFKLSCVGRLDKESEGLLLLTNDGDLQNRLAHPAHRVRKVYHVQIDKPLRQEAVPRLLRGIQWEGERLSVDKVFPVKTAGRENWASLEITIRHGRKREIRRLLYALGYEVQRLRRVQIGRLTVRRIPRGQFKFLSGRDLSLLFDKGGADD